MDKINKLRSYLGQLQDLEAGHLKELIISAGEDSQLLKKILVNAIEDEQAFLTMNEDIDRKEAEAIRDEELLEEIRREKIEEGLKDMQYEDRKLEEIKGMGVLMDDIELPEVEPNDWKENQI